MRLNVSETNTLHSRLNVMLAIEQERLKSSAWTRAPFFAILRNNENLRSWCGRMLKLVAHVVMLTSLQGCLDFEKARVAGDKGTNFAPSIDKKYVSPPPAAFIHRIPLASNCKALEFKIPPIRDFNKDDTLYYLWFFNGILLPPYQGI